MPSTIFSILHISQVGKQSANKTIHSIQSTESIMTQSINDLVMQRLRMLTQMGAALTSPSSQMTLRRCLVNPSTKTAKVSSHPTTMPLPPPLQVRDNTHSPSRLYQVPIKVPYHSSRYLFRCVLLVCGHIPSPSNLTAAHQSSLSPLLDIFGCAVGVWAQTISLKILQLPINLPCLLYWVSFGMCYQWSRPHAVQLRLL